MPGGADRRRHLDRLRYSRLPRAAGRLDEESRGREAVDAAELRRRSRGAQARVAEPASLAGVARAAERRPSRLRHARAPGQARYADHPEHRRPSREGRIVAVAGDRNPRHHARGRLPRVRRARAGEADPPCLTCRGILKSATISFGQGLVQDDLFRAQQAAASCDLMLAVGTKLSVYPIAGVVPVAKRAGARVIILNAEPTEMDELADALLRGSISDILPRLAEA